MTTRVFVKLLRLLLVLVAFQMTEVIETGRALGWFGDDTDCCDSCPNDEDGKRCPPDCPRCHCSHVSSRALPPGAESVLLGLPAPPLELAVPAGAAEAMRPPHLRGIYRPPDRSLAFGRTGALSSAGSRATVS